MGAWSEIKELHARTTLGAKEGVAFRYVSRPLASFLLYFLKDGRVTPNQVTILSLLVAVAGSAVHVTVLSYPGLVVGGALFMLAHVLDALDGQLARLRKAGSEVGMHFDFFIDELKAYLMLGALATRLYVQHHGEYGTSLLHPLVATFGPDGILYLAFLGLLGLSVGISCTQFLKLEAWKRAFPKHPAAPPSPARGAIALLEKAGRFVIDYPSYILILCLLDRADLYLWAYSAAVCLYCCEALTTIITKLWRVDPYGGDRSDGASSRGSQPLS